MNYFVTAIGTDSGKTLISAILCEAMGADYWKPVQAGLPRDTETVQKRVTNLQSRFFQERYLLQTPASPHAAAAIDGVQIRVADFHPPVSNRHLVIEGAGGALVPLNDDEVMLDLVPALQAEIILVSNLYLGSINHTLLTAEAIDRRGLRVRGLIFNGPSNPASESIILKKTGYPLLLQVDQEPEITTETVRLYAQKLLTRWS